MKKRIYNRTQSISQSLIPKITHKETH